MQRVPQNARTPQEARVPRAPQEGCAARTPRILIFSGTTEGCALAEALAQRKRSDITVCSATEYGSTLVPKAPCVHALSGRLDQKRMEDLLDQGAFDCVVDATHPYATEVTANIARAAANTATPRLRLLRESEPKGPWTCVPSAQDAAHELARRSGNILLTTGSKDLATYVHALPDFSERLFVRVLPLEDSISCARGLGVPLEHIIAMKGPFSRALNAALISEFDIQTLVTKASGATGGFWEKEAAAREAHIELLVIQRPAEEGGASFDEVLRRLIDHLEA